MACRGRPCWVFPTVRRPALSIVLSSADPSLPSESNRSDNCCLCSAPAEHGTFYMHRLSLVLQGLVLFLQMRKLRFRRLINSSWESNPDLLGSPTWNLARTSGSSPTWWPAPPTSHIFLLGSLLILPHWDLIFKSSQTGDRSRQISWLCTILHFLGWL